MKIQKVGKMVQEGLYVPQYKSVPSEGNTKKMKIRYNIEQRVSEDIYDIYDIVADMANALNEIIELNTDLETGEKVSKWVERQGQIKKIIGN